MQTDTIRITINGILERPDGSKEILYSAVEPSGERGGIGNRVKVGGGDPGTSLPPPHDQNLHRGR